MGLNFYYYVGLQPKMRAGIINEHECNHQNLVPIRFGWSKIVFFGLGWAGLGFFQKISCNKDTKNGNPRG